MTVFSTIQQLLADKPATAVAFAASGCSPLTYGGLRDHVGRTVASPNRLRGRGHHPPGAGVADRNPQGTAP